MREIKFRAWAEKTTKNKWNYAYERTEAIRKEFIRVNNEDEFDRYEWMDKYQKEWDELNPNGDEVTKTFGMITDIKVNGVVQRPYGYEVIDVMQYTGLKDKNGKEIYFGDILQTTNLEPGEGEDMWSKDTWGYTVCQEMDGELGVTFSDWHPTYENDCVFNWRYVEIIGNIYQDSRLLDTGV